MTLTEALRKARRGHTIKQWAEEAYHLRRWGCKIPEGIERTIRAAEGGVRVPQVRTLELLEFLYDATGLVELRKQVAAGRVKASTVRKREATKALRRADRAYFMRTRLL